MYIRGLLQYTPCAIRGYFCQKLKDAKIFKNHLNFLVFMGKLLLSSLRWVLIYQEFSHFSAFLHHFILAKLVTISIRVNSRSPHIHTCHLVSSVKISLLATSILFQASASLSWSITWFLLALSSASRIAWSMSFTESLLSSWKTVIRSMFWTHALTQPTRRDSSLFFQFFSIIPVISISSLESMMVIVLKETYINIYTVGKFEKYSKVYSSVLSQLYLWSPSQA